MKNPLLTHFYGWISDSGRKLILMHLLLIVMISQQMTGQTVTQTECYCLNNSTIPSNGQYLDTITITGSSGQNWRLMTTSNSNFFHPASFPPPAVPIPYLNNSVIPEISSGTYRIVGKRVSGQSWSVKVRNMNTNQLIDVSSVQTCSYPNFSMTGDEDVCRNSTELYSIPAPSGTQSYSGLTWFISGGFSGVLPVLPATGQTNINVMWGPTVGAYSLGVSGALNSFPAQSLGCSFTVSKIVEIEDISQATRIQGDAGNCVGTTEIYRINATVGQLSNVEWSLAPDPGMYALLAPIGGEGANQRTITWPTTGVFNLAVSGDYTIPGTNNSCYFTDTLNIRIVNEATPAMACQSLVNISMNPDCELYFQASQFLEGMMFSDTSYDIIIRDISTNTIVPQGALGYAYVGKTLEIKVVHECSGNSCWGYARIEDKSIPQLVCPDDITIECDDVDSIAVTGFPDMPIGAVRTPISGLKNTWRVTGFDKCSDVNISYTDAVVTSCIGDYSSVITRTWRAIDNTGNTTSCVQVLSILRSTLADVLFPANWDDIAGPRPSLKACGDWKKVPYVVNGKVQLDSVPDPSHTGEPIGIQCLKSHVTYTDRKLLLCDNNAETYKLFRKWTVFDHCTGRDTSYTQLIAVMDTEAPVVTCPADLINQTGSTINPAEIIFTKPYSCTADWSVLPPTVVYECSGYTWDVEFLLADSNGLPPVDGAYTKLFGDVQVTGTRPAFGKTIDPNARPWVIRNLPRGRTWIRYTITDKCGNFSYCFTEVDVKDNQPPVPVCDRNSIVAISNSAESGQGVGIAGVLTFDDGSHDNCGISCMKIRRMDQLVSWDSLLCDNRLTFTCADVNKTIMVELGVWDLDSAFNSCMVEAKIQDNIFPRVNAPDDMTISCKGNLTNLAVHGAATYRDNCTFTTRDSVVRELDDCNIGKIKRFFIARDVYGNTSVDSQIITVRNLNPIIFTDINWPGTITRNNQCMTRTSPKDLGSEPSVFSSALASKCSSVAFSHNDVEFRFSDGVCRKILRTWTAIDWCNNGTRFTNTQLIMITNDIAPEIVNGCRPDSLKITHEGTCQARVQITARATETATGDCSSNQLVWWYDLDINNNGSVDFAQVPGNSFDRLLDYGTHKLTWYVKDDCNNVGTCSNIFTLTDTKKPTPVCNSELVTVIMPSSREVSIWASDYLTSSTNDNCTPFSRIRASFSTNPLDISRTIRCIDLKGAPFLDTIFNVYAIDDASPANSDYCTVKLRVQSNNNSCVPLPLTLGLKGAIYSESAEMVQNVNVALISDQVEFPKSVMTQNDGKWNVEGLKMYKDYTITADKNDDILNGISTLDLVMIQRHILGLQELDSPYKLIAADVNNSQKVTAGDLVELRKVILGINSEFTNNKSWRFVDVAQQFVNPKNPFPFVEKLSMSNVNHDVAGLDFFAVKIGDVNGTARKNANSPVPTEPRNSVQLEANKVNAKKGEVFTVHVKSAELNNLLGLQMSIGVDYKYAEIVNIKSDHLNLKDENLGFRNISDGQIHISWNEQKPINVKDEFLQITFRALQDIKDRSILRLENSYLTPEMYISDGSNIQTLKVTLQSSNSATSNAEQFELFQNVPNPFNATSIIGFNLPHADEVTLKIFDLTGKMVFQSKATFNKGYNTFSLDANELNLSGVLYYQIETDNDSATRKMIIIK